MVLLCGVCSSSCCCVCVCGGVCLFVVLVVVAWVSVGCYLPSFSFFIQRKKQRNIGKKKKKI